MLSTKNKGRTGEDIATHYLQEKGYVILERNYATKTGEIDIIAVGEGFIVFVEVKARLNDNFGYAQEAVNYQKRRKINQVASEYIKRFKLFDRAIRFDIVEVYTEDKRIVHIENAFDSYLRY